MSKAEEKALKVYPVKMVNHYYSNDFSELEDCNKEKRELYTEGYEQAEKDMIERACNYLYDHRQGNKDVYQFIGLFRLAMEEGL